ncbi:MAG: protease modulator HflC [Thermodesulfobacteriota bacterium]
MSNKIIPVLIILVLLLVAVKSAVYTVDQTQQAIVVELGKPVSGTVGPGLHVKIPFIQRVVFLENRLLYYDAAPAEILTADKKNLIVDNYAKWRIVDPLKFYKTVRNVPQGLLRLDDIIYAELRVELGRHEMIDIISKLRSNIMDTVTRRADERAREYGISVADVRIKRADLPQENERAVYGRMRTERERQAKKYRSEGQEEALKIKAQADLERTVILAEAYRVSQEFRGEGDAEATRIYAEAYGQDPDFFNFLRTLQANRRALEKQTTLVLDPDDEFLRFLRESGTTLNPPSVEGPVRMPAVPVESEPSKSLLDQEPSLLDEVQPSAPAETVPETPAAPPAEPSAAPGESEG